MNMVLEKMETVVKSSIFKEQPLPNSFLQYLFIIHMQSFDMKILVGSVEKLWSIPILGYQEVWENQNKVWILNSWIKIKNQITLHYFIFDYFWEKLNS